MVELWRSLQPHFKAAWEQAKPYFMSLGKLQSSFKTNILSVRVPGQNFKSGESLNRKFMIWFEPRSARSGLELQIQIALKEILKC